MSAVPKPQGVYVPARRHGSLPGGTPVEVQLIAAV